jgi:hypothetical protein
MFNRTKCELVVYDDSFPRTRKAAAIPEPGPFLPAVFEALTPVCARACCYILSRPGLMPSQNFQGAGQRQFFGPSVPESQDSRGNLLIEISIQQVDLAIKCLFSVCTIQVTRAPKPVLVERRPPTARRFYFTKLTVLWVYIFVSSHVLASIANAAPVQATVNITNQNSPTIDSTGLTVPSSLT